ncbi:MAG: disulfide bond formation protein B [Betaproteobacteria bacterium]|nr:MAG: disulfide bond formation protein B [Betaproteobacteria bacterium]
MAAGVTSLALIFLPPRRIGYLLGFFVCAGLMGYALYLQYVMAGRTGAGVYALLQLMIGGAGAAIAARQVWLQSLPIDQVPACGMGLNYMLETLPFTDVLQKVLEGSGECAEKGWEFLHLSIAGWTLVFFVAMIAASFALIRRD